MTIDEIIKDIELVADDLFDNNLRADSDRLRDVVKELLSLKSVVKNLCDNVSRDEWRNPDNDPVPPYMPVLVRCRTKTDSNDGNGRKYAVVAMYESNASVWSRAIDHEPVNDTIEAWKYIYF